MTKVTTLFTLLITFFSSVVAEAQSNIPPLPQMITVEGGEFTMGCSKKDAPCDKDERPAHTVKLNTFLISKYEVSTAEYKQFATENQNKITFYRVENARQLTYN
jgi:formylglycine-generating enzyme